MSAKLRIMVVDDDLYMARTLVGIFKIKGYKAEAAYSALEALQRVEVKPLDCVLSDIRMPVVNGVELCRDIKALQPDLPVVLMTAYSADELVTEGLEGGATAVLTKPLDIDTLLSILAGLHGR